MPRVPAEIIKESYLLKATFFYENLTRLGFFKLFSEMVEFEKVHKATCKWDKRGEWGISEEAWEIIQGLEIGELMLFAHPNILRIRPSVIKYYRCIALLPQKGFQTLSGFSSIAAVENGKREIPEDRVVGLVTTINEFMSALIKLSSDLDSDQLKGMMYATAGTTIDGSWRNSIGAEGERVIKAIILRHLLKNSEVTSLINKDSSTSTPDDWDEKGPLSDVDNLRAIETINGSTVIFASEPDVTLQNAQGDVLGGIEVKAGLDPAGALERLGAMFKSFEDLKQSHPKAETILVASCITTEVETRIRSSRSVNITYILTEIINNKKGIEAKFANNIRSILGLIEKRM